ncbi:uncharacterized protein PFL1_00732 [Pseudozyma flocculosa PF-1]|uniref:Uncharacterized protein n=1 Tax=Pseudozyma flocculosa TaxID=84751 RepID=A0A5C3F2S2_9BASI|nr:uncharacterized protein PFL1_00732 [Pseudozyma flocculosa PF-1]EPQ31397.1 hypothetical protein PFL1_00732 [Pseudozyma flocculosa PF-1]SPO38823.1 uncharacterized protein PSFLO_04302 [Pseudozyma flocculosa]
MGKNKNKKEEQPTEFVKAGPSDCGVIFDASDATIEDAKKQIRLEHITKPWTRDAWEKAKPFVLEQRQKLEGSGWSSTDAARTELYVLRRNAPHGSFTEDGFMYVRVPKKFIDFSRSSSKADDDAAGAKADDAAADDGDKKKKSTRSKKKENAPSYEMTNEFIWKVKVDGDSDESARDPSVILDVAEPLENLFYLVQCLAPGMARLQYNRKDAIQPGTKQSDLRDDGDAPTMRHRAMVAASEKMTRTLPPAFWLKKNAEELKKIFGAEAFEATMHAAEDPQRATTRDVKNVQEKVWEEKIAAKTDDKKAKKDKAAKASQAVEPAVA